MIPTTSHADPQRGRRLLTILIAIAAMLAPLVIVTPAEATYHQPSYFCQNAWDQDEYIPLVSGDFGLPLWLSLKASPRTQSGSIPGSFQLCYGTGAPGDAKLAGGLVEVNPWLSDNPEKPGVALNTLNQADDNSALGNSVQVFVMPTGDADPGGATGDQTLLFRAVFMVCVGDYPNQICEPDYPTRHVQNTGVILGTITQTPAGPGGVSAAWRVSRLCLMVDGVPVTDCNDGVEDTGVTTTGRSPVTSSASYGPCVLSICIPTNADYVGTTGKRLATAYLPGVGAIPVNGVHLCVFQKDPNTQCPE